MNEVKYSVMVGVVLAKGRKTVGIRWTTLVTGLTPTEAEQRTLAERKSRGSVYVTCGPAADYPAVGKSKDCLAK
jgi:hypothetical protein